MRQIRKQNREARIILAVVPKSSRSLILASSLPLFLPKQIFKHSENPAGQTLISFKVVQQPWQH
jgi:hypothetical protein